HEELARMSDYDLYMLWFALKYPVLIIEDVKGGRDWQGWVNSTEALKGICEVTADDVASTNPRLVKRLIEFAAKQGKKAFTKLLIKINQIGTDAETLLTIRVM